MQSRRFIWTNHVLNLCYSSISGVELLFSLKKKMSKKSLEFFGLHPVECASQSSWAAPTSPKHVSVQEEIMLHWINFISTTSSKKSWISWWVYFETSWQQSVWSWVKGNLFGWSVEEGMCDACGRGNFQPLLYSKLSELLFQNGWWLITVGKLQKYVVESLQPRFSLAPMLSLRYALLAIPCDDNNNIVYG